MKQVLIIGYISQHGGSYRLAHLAKHLPEFGWQPIVLTAPLCEKAAPQLRVIETSYRDALGFWKKLIRFNPDEILKEQVKQRLGINFSKRSAIDHIMNFVLGIATYPDYERGWKPFAIRAGNELLHSENIDAMISCRPVISNIVASKLKEKYDIPWLVDYTDPWSQNAAYEYGPLRALFDKRLELKTVAKASALITISEPWAEKLRALHTGKPVYMITNGFDPDEVNRPPTKLTAKFTISYTGTIYTGSQNPSKLFKALRDLISDGTMNPNEVEVRFYGRKVVWLEKEIQQYGLSGVVKYYGIVSRETAMAKQRESHLLLILDWEDPKQRGIHTYKIFEYLGARRPILATGGQRGSIVAELLDKTRAGVHAVTVEAIKNTLKELYQEYKLKGEIAYKGKESEIDKYSYREMTKKFSEILNHLT